ncbi:MAG: hypothetical protein V4598_03320 [Bdellovibrionota bacterium]
MKSILLLSILLLLMSCNGAQDCSKQSGTKEIKQEAAVTGDGCQSPDPEDPDTDPTPEPLPHPEGEVPEEASTFEASIKFVNFEVEQEEKVHKAIDIIKKVIASDEFRTRVINYQYNGNQAYVDNKGLTNEEIYLKLLKGVETLIPEEDYEMDLELELYYSSKNTVGYTYPNTVRIWMNTKYFTPYTPTQVAGNIFHEWTHKLGFDHASTYSIARDSSVPYAVGYLIRDLGKQYE